MEYTDPLVWNGADSVLWNNVAAAYEQEIAAMYYQMRSKEYISYRICEDMFENEFAGKWNESVYNMDGKFKYIDPLIDMNNAAYLKNAQGSRQDHRKWWLYNRFRYIDSKYSAGDFLEDFIHLRLNTPVTWEAVEPNGDFDITTFADQYAQIKYGSYVFNQRAWQDQTVHFNAPNMRFTDTETIIYGASRIKSIGELASKYPGSVDITAGTKLTELIVGSDEKGYTNPWMIDLHVGNNTLLRKLDIRNCPELKQPVDLSGCESMEEVYATGTGITSVILPKAGILSRMELPETITNLSIMNQPNLKESGFSIAGVENLSTLRMENISGIDVFGLVEKCLRLEKPVLNRVRLLNVEGSGSDMKTLLKLATLAGLDENGNNLDKAVVTGIYYVNSTTDYELQRINEAFPELSVYYSNLVPAPVTTFVFSSNVGKTLEETELIAEGFEVERVNNNTFRIPATADGEVINFTFTAKNHRPRTGQYIVAGTRNQTYTATYEALRTIKVKVNGKELYPACRVLIDEVGYDIPENGSVQVRNNDAVTVKVMTIGYAVQIQTLGAIVNDTESVITIYESVPLTINVSNNEIIHNKTPRKSFYLPGASVELLNRTSGEKYTGVTNMYGDVTFMVAPGFTYDYIVRFRNSDPVSGDFSVYSYETNALRTVIIPVDILDLRPDENGNIQILTCISNNEAFTQSVTITSTGTHTIYWGDGNQDNVSAGDGINPVTVYHTYEHTSGLYQIEVDNASQVTAFTYSMDGLLAYWSIGNSKISNLSFSSKTYLRYVGKVFKNDTSRESFRQCFYNCPVLNNLPDGLFDECRNVTNIDYIFQDCKNLSAIPEGLFVNCTRIISCNYCFRGCNSLISIPEGLFDYFSNITNVSGCFYGCGSLKSIPVGLFNKHTGITNFSYCFYGCSSLTTIPDNLFVKFPEVTNFSNCFSGCSSLNAIPEKLFESNPKVTDFSNCFSKCSSVTVIPEYLFLKNPEVTNFTNCFTGCSSLRAIPEKLFSTNPKVTTFSYCFSECRSLVEIPENLFENNPAVTSFSACFHYCTSLTTIPENLFANNILVIEFQHCFNNCSSLTAIPGLLFANNRNAYNFLQCFYYCSSLISIPANLFENNRDINNVGSCFGYCSSLISIPEDLFKYNTKLTNMNGCFSSCTSLTTIPERLFANNTELTSIGCFSSCTSLTSIPENLFVNNLKVTSFSGCFYRCTSLTVIPENLFANQLNATNFSQCFDGCSSLSGIPENLFANNPEVTTFYYCFRDCSSLTGIPENLFVNNPEVTTFSYCFRGCSSLTGIPEKLFANQNKVKNFSMLFYGCISLTSIPERLFANNPEATDFTYCFQDCSSLTTIPELLFDNSPGTTNIAYCFYGCTSLSSVILPVNIQTLGNYAYYRCLFLKYIQAKTEIPPTITSNTFAETSNCPIYVPDNALDNYKTASNWNTIAYRIYPISQKPD